MFQTDPSSPALLPLADAPTVPGLEIINVIAQGGHGTVYRAHQAEHDRIVAVKVLDGRLVDDIARRRFDRERSAIGRLSDHPSIVSLLGSGFTEAGVPYLLLEYAPGGSLAERLMVGPLRLEEATKLAVCLAAAAERAHLAGVVHRDIKPANILRSAYGDWMLTDFGIASLINSAETRTVHVSYAHTAPENFDGGVASPAADVYSLASVLATCLTTSEPFRVQSEEIAMSAARRVATDPYPDLRLAGVPDDLAEILETALSKKPSDRPQTARSFGELINQVRSVHGLSAVAIRTGNEGDDLVDTLEVDLAEDLPIPVGLESAPPNSGSVEAARGSKLAIVIAAFVFLIGLGIGGLAWTAAADGAGSVATTPNADPGSTDGAAADGDVTVPTDDIAIAVDGAPDGRGRGEGGRDGGGGNSRGNGGGRGGGGPGN